jgi:hypothetical protein
LFDSSNKCHVIAFLNSALLIELKNFEDDLPKVDEIDCLDPFCVFRFLQSVYSNYLTFVAKNSSTFKGTTFKEAQQWKGGSADDFTKYIHKIRKLMSFLL